MHQIFIVTACCYTRLGLTVLMAQNPERAVVIPVSKPEEVGRVPPSGTGTRLLLVDMVGQSRTVTRNRVFLWRWAGLRRQEQTENLPCVLLENRVSGPGECSLRSSLSLPLLAAELSDILLHPENYRRCPVRSWQVRLSERQSEVLGRMLSGDSVQAIASALSVSRQSVFASRDVLIEKLGLRNRIELMSLTERDFQ